MAAIREPDFEAAGLRHDLMPDDADAGGGHQMPLWSRFFRHKANAIKARTATRKVLGR
jgi:hypothetical protein